MKRIQITCASLLIISAILFGTVAHAEETLRPEVSKPMLAAQELIKSQKYREALAKIRDAEAVPARTAYESFIIERMRATAAAGAGDTELAAKSFETLINSGKLPKADQLQMIEALASTYYSAKNYTLANGWIQKYFKSGGTNPQMRTLFAQSLYLSGDYAAASKEITAINADAERAGGVPAENMLQLQASCQNKAKDYAGYIATQERLIKHYPKMEYWAEMVSRVQSKPGFSDRLLLDIYRLRYAIGSLVEANAYQEYAQLALQDGFPAEAKKIVNEGFDKKLLGAGANASRHNRLRDLANRQAGEDLAALNKKSRVSDANTQVNDGYDFVTHGEVEKGINIMEKAIAKGGLKRPDDASLHLGMAYLQAGNKAKAAQALKTVLNSVNGVGDIAKLWMLQGGLE
ncbi:MAG: tetratricopeptide repeat protein [Methylotenera sp.]|nr:tetratricopeptide repeat protein [Methylotenera sp.]